MSQSFSNPPRASKGPKLTVSAQDIAGAWSDQHPLYQAPDLFIQKFLQPRAKDWHLSSSSVWHSLSSAWDLPA